jgi:hypothetical protein
MSLDSIVQEAASDESLVIQIIQHLYNSSQMQKSEIIKSVGNGSLTPNELQVFVG